MEFFRTVMGQRFFEGTLPNLVHQLDRLNVNLERRHGDISSTTPHCNIADARFEVTCRDCPSRVIVMLVSGSNRLIDRVVSHCPRCGSTKVDVARWQRHEVIASGD